MVIIVNLYIKNELKKTMNWSYCQKGDRRKK